MQVLEQTSSCKQKQASSFSLSKLYFNVYPASYTSAKDSKLPARQSVQSMRQSGSNESGSAGSICISSCSDDISAGPELSSCNSGFTSEFLSKTLQPCSTWSGKQVTGLLVSTFCTGSQTSLQLCLLHLRLSGFHAFLGLGHSSWFSVVFLRLLG